MIELAVADPDVARPHRSSREALSRLLDELESLLVSIRTDVYVDPRCDTGLTIGATVAGCLRRIAGLLDGRAERTNSSGDAEQSALALDPVAALKRIRWLRARASGWSGLSSASMTRVDHAGDSLEDLETRWSTVATDAAFVVSDTLDAQRSIVQLLARLGLSAPERFGSMPQPALPARSSTPPSWALWERLDQITALLLELPPGVYTAPVDRHVSGTVGEHVRHCLDHVSALLSADGSGTLSYDRRRRGAAIETDPGSALQLILRLKAALQRWASRSLDQPIRVSSMIDASGRSITGWSTLGRELAFVLTHTIHHQATMAAVLALHGVATPAGFGYAPSTPRHG